MAIDCIGCGVFFWNKNILNTRNARLIPCKCNIDVILLALHPLFTTAKKIADVVCDRKRQRGRRSSLHKKGLLEQRKYFLEYSPAQANEKSYS